MVSWLTLRELRRTWTTCKLFPYKSTKTPKECFHYLYYLLIWFTRRWSHGNAGPCPKCLPICATLIGLPHQNDNCSGITLACSNGSCVLSVFSTNLVCFFLDVAQRIMEWIVKTPYSRITAVLPLELGVSILPTLNQFYRHIWFRLHTFKAHLYQSALCLAITATPSSHGIPLALWRTKTWGEGSATEKWE